MDPECGSVGASGSCHRSVHEISLACPLQEYAAGGKGGRDPGKRQYRRSDTCHGMAWNSLVRVWQEIICQGKENPEKSTIRDRATDVVWGGNVLVRAKRRDDPTDRPYRKTGDLRQAHNNIAGGAARHSRRFGSAGKMDTGNYRISSGKQSWCTSLPVSDRME